MLKAGLTQQAAMSTYKNKLSELYEPGGSSSPSRFFLRQIISKKKGFPPRPAIRYGFIFLGKRIYNTLTKKKNRYAKLSQNNDGHACKFRCPSFEILLPVPINFVARRYELPLPVVFQNDGQRNLRSSPCFFTPTGFVFYIHRLGFPRRQAWAMPSLSFVKYAKTTKQMNFNS